MSPTVDAVGLSRSSRVSKYIFLNLSRVNCAIRQLHTAARLPVRGASYLQVARSAGRDADDPLRIIPVYPLRPEAHAVQAHCKTRLPQAARRQRSARRIRFAVTKGLRKLPELRVTPALDDANRKVPEKLAPLPHVSRHNLIVGKPRQTRGVRIRVANKRAARRLSGGREHRLRNKRAQLLQGCHSSMAGRHAARAACLHALVRNVQIRSSKSTSGYRSPAKTALHVALRSRA
jgi:hypothetical protein